MQNTLSWIKANELPSGGIAAWPGKCAYPEVTGYLIPTLVRHGEIELALRCATWLTTIQHPTGGFASIDGTTRLHGFDTAACYQGLRCAHDLTGVERYGLAASMATSFLSSLMLSSGHFEAWPGGGVRQYCARINGILSVMIPFAISWSDRVHFLAYALEGYLNLGYIHEVRFVLQHLPSRPDGLMYHMLQDGVGYGDDVIATCQIAMLKHRVGLDASPQIEAARRHIHPNGGVPQSTTIPTEMAWGAKFYLDMEAML